MAIYARAVSIVLMIGFANPAITGRQGGLDQLHIGTATWRVHPADAMLVGFL